MPMPPRPRRCAICSGDDLLAQGQPSQGLMGKLSRWFGGQEPEPVKGLYLWGGVGRGKTYLMDTFYDSLPFDDKLRIHFHRFMQRVHAELKRLAGTKNPLDEVAKRFAENTRIICFDEFFVTDITDAMILGGLFEKLFALNVTLVATSNIEPDRLYENGLQRQRFLPAIKLINRHTEVLNIDGGVDYRLRALEQAELYHSPLDEESTRSLERSFAALTPEHGTVETDGSIEINDRQIAYVRCCDGILWCEFAALCDGPRSQNDYIELARLYKTVLIANVPVLGPDQDDQARRFINLIDEFYDSGVKVIITAAAPMDELYQGQRLQFEFQRTLSRLVEMQSTEYLGRAHKA